MVDADADAERVGGGVDVGGGGSEGRIRGDGELEAECHSHGVGGGEERGHEAVAAVLEDVGPRHRCDEGAEQAVMLAGQLGVGGGTDTAGTLEPSGLGHLGEHEDHEARLRGRRGGRRGCEVAQGGSFLLSDAPHFIGRFERPR